MSLIIENLTKTYSNKVKALDNLSLKIGKGMLDYLVQTDLANQH